MRQEVLANSSQIYWPLQMILQELGFSWEERVVLQDSFLKILESERQEPKAAQLVWSLLGVRSGIVKEKLKERATLIHSQVSGFVSGQDTLDFGSGDGQVGTLISQERSVTLYDVADYRASEVVASELEFSLDWNEMAGRSFDTAMSLLVFHHTENPDEELSRLVQVCHRLVVIESVIDDTIMPWAAQATIDWVYNRGLHPGASIPVTGQFRTPQQWRDTFKRFGFSIIHDQDLGIDLPIVPEHHWLFVLDREES